MTARRHTISRRTLLAATAAAPLAAPLPLRASTYPDRPLTVLVPFATGGYNDRYARAIAPFLQRHFGQPVVVQNRPGGGTMLGNMFFLQQPDDGYMVMVHSAGPFIPLSIITRNAQYKAEDFWMINLPSRDSTLMATATSKPFQNANEVIAQLKRDPRSLSVGIQPASADLVNLALLAQGHGIDRNRMRIVTYDGGGPARTATMGGHVDVGLVGGEGFEDAPLITDHAKAAGFSPEFVDGSQRGFVVSARFRERAPDRYRVMEQAIERTTKDPECIAAMQAQQLATTWYGPEASNAAYLRSAGLMQKYADLLKAA